MNDDGDEYRFETKAEAEPVFDEVVANGTPSMGPDERTGTLVIFKETREVVKWETPGRVSV